MTPLTGPSDRGYVLINALLIVAALSALAVQSLGDATRRQGEISAAQMGGEVAAMADAGVAFAANLISKDFSDRPVDHPGEAWAITNRQIDIGRGAVLVTIKDAQALFNLNSLRGIEDAAEGELVERLVEAYPPGPNTWTSLQDHFAAQRSPADTQDKEEAPEWFVPGDLTHIYDLARIPGMTPDYARVLGPRVSVLPQAHGLNVNTADRETLAAITGLGRDTVEAVLIRRANSPFDDLPEFIAFLQENASDDFDLSSFERLLSVSSGWFDVRTEIVLEEVRVVHMTRLFRDPDNGRVTRFYRHKVTP